MWHAEQTGPCCGSTLGLRWFCMHTALWCRSFSAVASRYSTACEMVLHVSGRCLVRCKLWRSYPYLNSCAAFAQGAMRRQTVRNPRFSASSMYPKTLCKCWAARGLCKTSEVQDGAAATGNDVCKEYKASRVAYDYSTRGEDWATNAEWKCAHSSITLCLLKCLSRGLTVALPPGVEASASLLWTI